MLELTPERDAARNDLVERQAASIYKQGEQARAAGQTRVAVDHFCPGRDAWRRSRRCAPTAQYDAVGGTDRAQGLGRGDRTLEDFRTRFPNHALQGEVSGKLAVAYLEKGKWAQRRRRVRAPGDGAGPDPKIARDALWQAAELYEKAGSRAERDGKAYERYLAKYPQPLEPAVEARQRLVAARPRPTATARASGADEGHLQRRPERPAARAPTAPAISAPRRRWRWPSRSPTSTAGSRWSSRCSASCGSRRREMEEALKAYAKAADYGVAEVSTAANYASPSSTATSARR